MKKNQLLKSVKTSKKNNATMQFFSYAHLPEEMQKNSKPFADLAELMDKTLPDNPEKSTCLRKLLEAKDCAVRAKIFKGK